MGVVTTSAAAIVVLAGVWLIGLAAVAFARPERVKDFFANFASSAFTHFLEMFVRIVVGAAFLVYAPHMRFSIVFTVFGWMLILTSVALLFVPWRLHRRFADRALPLATGRMKLFGLVALAGGIFNLFSFFAGPDMP